MRSNQHSWPRPVICVDCFDEVVYLQEKKEVKKADEFNRCSECGTKPPTWYSIT